MKRFVVIMLSLLLSIFIIQCGNDSENGQTPGQDKAPAEKSKTDKVNKKGKPGKENKDEKIEIPERMQQAIKSGRMTKKRALEILKRMKEKGGGFGRGRGGGNAPAVQVEPVQNQDINAFLVLNGTVEPERKVEVYSRLPAYVKSIVREEGDVVEKGDILALLDDTEIRISHRQAEIQLNQAELTLKDETANYNRSKKLKETDMISEQDIQLAQATYNKARLDHQTKLETFKDLDLQLSYTKIKAPVGGYVTERMIEVGTRVNTNQQVYTVEDFSPLLIKVYVPTSDVVNLRTEMESEVSTDVLGTRVFKGKIKLINPRIDVQSGTVKVTVEVFDNTRNLKPGMFVETRILIRNNPGALVVPKKAVSYKDEKAFVFVFKRKDKDMLVEKRDIETGISEGDFIEVVSGLEADEQIVVVGIEGLKDKMKVRVIR